MKGSEPRALLPVLGLQLATLLVTLQLSVLLKGDTLASGLLCLWETAGALAGPS